MFRSLILCSTGTGFSWSTTGSTAVYAYVRDDEGINFKENKKNSLVTQLLVALNLSYYIVSSR